ncbi:hypothetical protein HDU99_001777, partial [Rhizoclosmatium hyalinum]
TAGLTPDELFAWRVEKLGILEAMRLLELEQVEQDKILAQQEKERMENVFEQLSVPVPSTGSHFFDKADSAMTVGNTDDSSFTEEEHNKIMMDYVFGPNNPLVKRNASLDLPATAAAATVAVSTVATSLETKCEDEKVVASITTVIETEEDELDELLFSKDIPVTNSVKSAVSVETTVSSADTEETDEQESKQTASIWGVGTVALAVGVVAIAGYLAFGRGKRRVGRK